MHQAAPRRLVIHRVRAVFLRRREQSIGGPSTSCAVSTVDDKEVVILPMPLPVIDPLTLGTAVSLEPETPWMMTDVIR